jgi:predicted ATPase
MINNFLKINELRTKNYKNMSMENNGVAFNNLNILIGSNGSGKSNFINIFKFLRNSIEDVSVEERGVTSFDDAVSDLGGERMLDITLARPANVEFQFTFSPSDINPKGGVLDIHLFVQKTGRVFNNYEVLYGAVPSPGKPEPFYYYKCHDTKPGSGVFSLFQDDYKKTSRFEALPEVPTNRLVLAHISRLLEQSSHPPEMTPIYKFRRDLVDTISQWRFYNANDMNLYAIRHAEPKIGPSDLYLSPSGDNLPLVLFNLIQEDVGFEEQIEYAMKAILPDTKRIRAGHSGRLSLTVEWFFRQTEKEPLYLNEMSDGTVRMLCWAAILHSPFLPPFLSIDEPEIGLHPAWMPILADWIKKAAEKTQIFIITHSADLLDHFTDNLEDVFCFCGKDTSHFGIKKIQKESVQPKIDDGWQLGDLYRVGDPSVGGWPW